MSKQKVKVPDSLRDILLEFSIAYLLEQPGDVIDFAVDFFTKLQTNRAQTGIDIDVTKASTPDDTASQDDGEWFLTTKALILVLAIQMNNEWQRRVAAGRTWRQV